VTKSKKTLIPWWSLAVGSSSGHGDAIDLPREETDDMFLCLGNQNISMSKRVYSFTTSGDLSKHYRREHLSNLKKGQQPVCNLCMMLLEHKLHLQNHAMKILGIVS
jgi:hypothetical protein